jgi:hypothetical protein
MKIILGRLPPTTSAALIALPNAKTPTIIEVIDLHSENLAANVRIIRKQD